MMTNVLARKIVGAVLAAVALALIFSVFGYSDGGPTVSDYSLEVVLALVSFLPAAFLMQRLIKRHRVFLEIAGVALIGSTLSFLMKLIFLEGENGIPAYFARAARDHSWKPFADLVFDAVSFVILTTLLSLPFVAVGFWLYRLWAKPDIDCSDNITSQS